LPAEFVDRNWLWRRLYIHTGVQANINCFAAFDGMNQPFWISHSCSLLPPICLSIFYRCLCRDMFPKQFYVPHL
jgi:hypothetical protein